MSTSYYDEATGTRITFTHDYTGGLTVELPDEVSRLRAELARLRPVVEAAEALVEHWDAAEQAGADYIVRNGKLLYALAAKVKEAQR